MGIREEVLRGEIPVNHSSHNSNNGSNSISTGPTKAKNSLQLPAMTGMKKRMS